MEIEHSVNCWTASRDWRSRKRDDQAQPAVVIYSSATAEGILIDESF